MLAILGSRRPRLAVRLARTAANDARASRTISVGSSPLPRSEVVSKVWDHIRKNNLQNPNNKREILADDKLRKVFGTDKCTMFEMNKHLSKHLS